MKRKLQIVKNPFAKKKKGGSVVRNSLALPMPNRLYNRPGVDEVYRVKLRYNTTVNLTTAGGGTDYIFNMTSVYDPDNSGVGLQPQYYDTYSAMYQKYVVVGTDAKVRIINNDSTDIVNLYTFLQTSNATQIAAADGTWLSQNFAKWTTCGALLTGKPAVELPWIHYPGNIFPKDAKNPDTAAGERSALITASPTKNRYLHCICKNTIGNALNCDLQVQIIYDVVFYNREIGGMD